MKIKSTYALLDVQDGRKNLMRRLKEGESIRLSVELVIPATDYNWKDDGISTEFVCEVLNAEEVV